MSYMSYWLTSRSSVLHWQASARWRWRLRRCDVREASDWPARAAPLPGRPRRPPPGSPWQDVCRRLREMFEKQKQWRCCWQQQPINDSIKRQYRYVPLHRQGAGTLAVKVKKTILRLKGPVCRIYCIQINTCLYIMYGAMPVVMLSHLLQVIKDKLLSDWRCYEPPCRN